MSRWGVGWFVALVAALGPTAVAHAQTKSVTPRANVAFEAGPGQRHLVLSFRGDTIHARACPKKDCDPTGGAGIRPPASLRAKVESASVEAISVGGGKQLAFVRIEADGGRFFGLLLASKDKVSDTPQVIWSGFAGGAADNEQVVLKRDDKGAATSFALLRRASICGREVPTSSRRLDSGKLVLVDETVPDPVASLRGAAVSLKAELEDKPAATHRILHANAASSGSDEALTDGDASRAWVEDVAGAGTRSFVSMTAPEAVPIAGFDFVLDPKGIEGARAPRSVSILTDAGLFSATFAEDAVARGSATYGVVLPKAIQTKCVAVVVDDVFAGKGRAAKGQPAGAAFISEVSARTALDGESLDQLARSLGSAGPEQKLREAVLSSEREAGVAAIASVYGTLDLPARDRARRIVDAAPCEQRLKVYLPFLEGAEREESDRARDRIRRCGKEAGPVLMAALGQTLSLRQRGAIAEEAALLAPALAVPGVLQALAAAKSGDERLAFRKAVAKAAQRETGLKVVEHALGDATFSALPLPARIDVVRALGEALPKMQTGPLAFETLTKEAVEFRDRYVLLPAAAELARAGEDAGLSFLMAATDAATDPRLRARAAELAFGVDKLRPRIVEMLDDEKVRVREAALLSLTQPGAVIGKELSAKLLERLTGDPWTFVRRAAVTALGAAPSDAPVDAKIGAAVDFEESAAVRTEMVRALGARRAKAQRKVIAARAFDGKEAVEVRAAAALALGQICDKDSIEPLTELAVKGQSPQFEVDGKLAIAAAQALGILRPSDLATRLAPIAREGVAPEMRAAAQRALKSKTPGCK